jgi:hypothetical protein
VSKSQGQAPVRPGPLLQNGYLASGPETGFVASVLFMKQKIATSCLISYTKYLLRPLLCFHICVEMCLRVCVHRTFGRFNIY